MATGTTWALIAARMGSTRLPGKALVDLAGKPALVRVIERLQMVPSLDGICVATTTLGEDDNIVGYAIDAGASYHRGESDDLLARLLGAAKTLGAETIVYITADCPLVDPGIVERAIQEFREYPDTWDPLTGLKTPGCDYASNRLRGYAYPIGMDVEVFSAFALSRADVWNSASRDREHVTTCFYEHQDEWLCHSIEPPENLHRPEIRLTLDTEEDLAFLRAIYDGMRGVPYGLSEIITFLDTNPHLLELNRHVEQVVP